jgi:hypothetical protein
MNILLVLILFLGLMFYYAHQYKVQQEIIQNQPARIEYRYLPLSLDQWFKESQYSATNVMNSLVSDVNGYCNPITVDSGAYVDEQTPSVTPTTQEPTFQETKKPEDTVSFV